MDHLKCFFLSLSLSLLFTYIVREAARKLDILDKPDPGNPGKIHKKPVALMGGLGIYLTFITICGLLLRWNLQIFGIVSTATVLMIVGILDDLHTLHYRPRLFIQLAVAIFVIFVLDVKVGFISNPLISIPISILWLVGVTNALNLMDNVDGATAGVTFIASTILFIIATMNQQPIPALMSLALAGASFGFLKFNFKPASIFLGDTGTLLIGFLLATIALLETQNLSLKINNVFLFPMILGFPIYDTTLATALRLKNGRSICLADKSNLTYRLFDLGFKEKETVLLEYALATYFGLCALLLTQVNGIITIFIVGFTTFLLISLGVVFHKTNSFGSDNFESDDTSSFDDDIDIDSFSDREYRYSENEEKTTFSPVSAGRN